MTKFFLGINLLMIFSLTACKKDSENTSCPYNEPTSTATTAERDSIKRYLAANNLTATEHTRGVFYIINSAGTGTITPTICSFLKAEYVGSFFSGKVFDPMNPSTPKSVGEFYLGQVIEGWKYAIPLLKAGGSITLFIPPSLGYGSVDMTNNGVVVIPRNTYLKFEVSLQTVENR